MIFYFVGTSPRDASDAIFYEDLEDAKSDLEGYQDSKRFKIFKVTVEELVDATAN